MISPQILIPIVVIMGGVLYLATSSAKKVRGRILCTLRRIDGTREERLVREDARYVKFEGERYKIDPKRVTLHWYNRGIHKFFPQYVPALDFSWYSEVPHDPDQFEDTWDTPAARNAASSEDDWKGFNKGLAAQTGKPGGFIEKYKYVLILIVLGLVGYVLYTQGQVADARMDALEALIRMQRG